MVIYGDLMGCNGIYPLIVCYIAIEHGHLVVDLPFFNMVLFQFASCSFTRGYMTHCQKLGRSPTFFVWEHDAAFQAKLNLP